jgi:hypothetical protein
MRVKRPGQTTFLSETRAIFVEHDALANRSVNATDRMLNNLERLRLIAVDLETVLADSEAYDQITRSPTYEAEARKWEQIGLEVELHLLGKMGVVELSPLGRQFALACIRGYTVVITNGQVFDGEGSFWEP